LVDLKLIVCKIKQVCNTNQINMIKKMEHKNTHF